MSQPNKLALFSLDIKFNLDVLPAINLRSFASILAIFKDDGSLFSSL